MLDIVVAVLLSLFLGPGMGQLYNREYKKGGYLFVVSLIVFGGAAMWCFKASQPYLPADLTTIDPSALQEMLRNAASRVASDHRGTLAAYKLILFGLWLYSVVDAALVALRRKKIVEVASKEP